jgi:hypothetical protein
MFETVVAIVDDGMAGSEYVRPGLIQQNGPHGSKPSHTGSGATLSTDSPAARTVHAYFLFSTVGGRDSIYIVPDLVIHDGRRH